MHARSASAMAAAMALLLGVFFLTPPRMTGGPGVHVEPRREEPTSVEPSAARSVPDAGLAASQAAWALLHGSDEVTGFLAEPLRLSPELAGSTIWELWQSGRSTRALAALRLLGASVAPLTVKFEALLASDDPTAAADGILALWFIDRDLILAMSRWSQLNVRFGRAAEELAIENSRVKQELGAETAKGIQALVALLQGDLALGALSVLGCLGDQAESAVDAITSIVRTPSVQNETPSFGDPSNEDAALHYAAATALVRLGARGKASLVDLLFQPDSDLSLIAADAIRRFPEGVRGDVVLARALRGRRDEFSVGVVLELLPTLECSNAAFHSMLEFANASSSEERERFLDGLAVAE